MAVSETDKDELVTISREVAVAADSLLSWLWHRHTPQAVRQQEQQEYDKAIAGLRAAYERKRSDSCSE